MLDNRPAPAPLVHSTQALKDALAEYDRTAPARERLWVTIEKNEDVARAEAADLAALTLVRDAFYQATQDRNNRENCSRVDLDFMRQIAARY